MTIARNSIATLTNWGLGMFLDLILLLFVELNSTITNHYSFHRGVGRECGVGRGLGVTLGVAVGVGVVVGVEVGVGVTLGVGVGVGGGLDWTQYLPPLFK
jgi:hypothetical protein